MLEEVVKYIHKDFVFSVFQTGNQYLHTYC